MKKRFSGLRIRKLLCLLFTVGIFCICSTQTVHATALDVDRGETGDTASSTTLQDPGEAETPEELTEMNIANTATITVSNNNGTIAGELRILLTPTT